MARSCICRTPGFVLCGVNGIIDLNQGQFGVHFTQEDTTKWRRRASMFYNTLPLRDLYRNNGIIGFVDNAVAEPNASRHKYNQTHISKN